MKGIKVDSEHETYKVKFQEKLPENPENKYNHNFSGAYCTCNRPYPDPENPDEDEMIQCCLCEDWYHGKVSDTRRQYMHYTLYNKFILPHFGSLQIIVDYES